MADKKEEAAAPAAEEKADGAAEPKGKEGGISMGLFLGIVGGSIFLGIVVCFLLAFFVVPKKILAGSSASSVGEASQPSESPGEEKSEGKNPAEGHGDKKSSGHGDKKKEEGHGKSGGHGDKKGEGSHGEKGEEAGLKEVEEFILNEMLVNIAGTRGARYLKVSLVFDASTDVLTQLEAQRPKIIDMVTEIISSKTMDEITAPTGRGILRTELLAAVNGVLKKGKVKNIFYVDFVIQ